MCPQFLHATNACIPCPSGKIQHMWLFCDCLSLKHSWTHFPPPVPLYCWGGRSCLCLACRWWRSRSGDWWPSGCSDPTPQEVFSEWCLWSWWCSTQEYGQLKRESICTRIKINVICIKILFLWTQTPVSGRRRQSPSPLSKQWPIAPQWSHPLANNGLESKSKESRQSVVNTGAN